MLSECSASLQLRHRFRCSLAHRILQSLILSSLRCTLHTSIARIGTQWREWPGSPGCSLTEPDGCRTSSAAAMNLRAQTTNCFLEHERLRKSHMSTPASLLSSSWSTLLVLSHKLLEQSGASRRWSVGEAEPVVIVLVALRARRCAFLHSHKVAPWSCQRRVRKCSTGSCQPCVRWAHAYSGQRLTYPVGA